MCIRDRRRRICLLYLVVAHGEVQWLQLAVGAAVGDVLGPLDGSSSINSRSTVSTPGATGTVIEFGSPLSLSITSVKPGRVHSTTVYVPSGTPSNTKVPSVPVIVVPTTTPSATINVTATPTIGSSQSPSSSVSSRIIPETLAPAMDPTTGTGAGVGSGVGLAVGEEVGSAVGTPVVAAGSRGCSW